MDTERHNDASQSTPAAAGVSYRYGNHLGESIAIIGMACRFPGANDVQSFWRLLEAGEHAITEGEPGSGIGRVGELFRGKTVQSEACRFAAFIDDVDRFDAEFFRISPVEAQFLGLAQKLLKNREFLGNSQSFWARLLPGRFHPVGSSHKLCRSGVWALYCVTDFLSPCIQIPVWKSGAARSLHICPRHHFTKWTV